MDKISAVIITYNAAATIGDCIDALKKVSDEIIVIDSFSTDTTPQICLEKKVVFYLQSWLGYGPQKNFGISKSQYDYILSVDADEIVSDELAASILKEKQKGLTGIYGISHLNYYYTGFVKHGADTPTPKVRLFNKTQVRWNDKEVHEGIIVPEGEKIKKLEGYFYHYSYPSIAYHIQKANTYTTLSAQELNKKGRKNYLFKMIFSPPINFFISYIIRLGFLDGTKGFIVAKFSAHGSFVKYAKLWELHHKKKDK